MPQKLGKIAKFVAVIRVTSKYQRAQYDHRKLGRFVKFEFYFGNAQDIKFKLMPHKLGKIIKFVAVVRISSNKYQSAKYVATGNLVES